MKKLDVLLIGAINYDVYVPHSHNLVETSAVIDGIRLAIGGGASITAIALATLGLSSAVAGSVGKHAEIIKQILEEKGVEHFLEEFPKVETAITVADHYDDGSKRYRVDVTANKQFTPNNIRQLTSIVQDSKVVMRTGYPWMPQIAGQPTAELFEHARLNDVMTAFDMSNPDLWEVRMLEELVSDVLPYVDLLCANEKELYRLARRPSEPQIDSSELEEYMTQERVSEFAQRVLDMGVTTVNSHDGAKGTAIITKDEQVHEEPATVDRFVNPTGCGNLQNAGVIYSMLKGDDISYAAKFGNAMAILRLSGYDFPILSEVKAHMGE